MKRPSIVSLELRQIEMPPSSLGWCTGLRHLPKSIPTVRQASLSLLSAMQPLVVTKVPLPKGRTGVMHYSLLAGRRTLQLLLEQFPRDYKTWALCVGKEDFPDVSDLEVLDTLLFKLLCRPDGDDLSVIAAALKEDSELREVANRYVDVSNDEAIGNLVGMSRTGLHRSTVKARKHLLNKETPKETVSLELLPIPETLEKPISDLHSDETQS